MTKSNNNGNNIRKKDEVTCIQLPKKLRDDLAEKGKKSETFADIIRGLMETPCAEKVGDAVEKKS